MTQLNEFLTLLEWALDPAHGHPDQNPDRNQIVTGFSGVLEPLSRQKGEVYWLNHPLFSMLRKYKSTTELVANKETVDLAQLRKSHTGQEEQGINIVLDAVVAKISCSVNRPITDIEPSRPVYAIGLDSILTLGICYWFMKEVKANLAVFDIMGAATLYEVSSLAWRKSPYATAN